MPIWRTQHKEFAIVTFLFFKIYALVTDTFLGKEKKDEGFTFHFWVSQTGVIRMKQTQFSSPTVIKQLSDI